MWPFIKNRPPLVTVIIKPDCVSCSWMSGDLLKKRSILVEAYTSYVLDKNQLYNGLIYNPTDVQNKIISFLKMYHLKNACITIAVEGPQTYTEYISTPSSRIESTHFELDPLVWQSDYMYLYPNRDNTFVFYVHAISQVALLQYNLMMLSAHLNLLTITSTTMALLYLYKYAQGENFRQAQLATDMMQINNIIEQYFTPERISQLLPQAAAWPRDEDVKSLLVSMGLYVHYKERL